ncbi:helix-turn-helix domain-containing protein [Roseococcus sp. SYP-B2431]|uniref:helix-turn-helix domain-containing protein n=1 Tax=Roseococcus sp. SYP-B2431 TaxID=2496640 RepID=UPI00103A4BB3|nr:helix-turn-helix domain-containing protein [Roseococcus sp. SYP-B2431]
MELSLQHRTLLLRIMRPLAPQAASDAKGNLMLDQTPSSRRTEHRSSEFSVRTAAEAPRVASNRSPTLDDGQVGRRMKDLRRKQGLTQKQIAGRVGVTGAQLHRYETGATRVAASRLIAIAAVLGVRPEDLMREPVAAPMPSLSVGGAPSSNDLVELVELFSSLTDDRRRGAVMGFARSISVRHQPPMMEAAGVHAAE